MESKVKTEPKVLLAGLIAILIAGSGLLFPAARKLILGLSLLALGAVLMENAKEGRPRAHNLMLGLLIVPMLIAGFFFKFPGDLVFIYLILLFAGMLVFPLSPDRKQWQVSIFTSAVFLGAFIGAVMINFKSVSHPSSWFHKKESLVENETTRHPKTDAPELAPFFTGDSFYYVGEFFLNYVYLMKNDGGKYFGELSGGYCVADVHTARETTAIVFYDSKTGKFAMMDMQDPKFEKLKLEELQFVSADPDNFVAKAWARASNPNAYEKDRKQGKRALWIYADTTANSQQVVRYHAEAAVHTEPKSGYKFFELIGVTLERSCFMIDGKAHKYRTFQTDPLGTPLEKPQDREMKDGDLASAIWRLYETHVIE